MNKFLKSEKQSQLTHRESKCRRFLEQEIRLEKNSILLEIGSGGGRQALWAASSGVHIIATEINAKSCLNIKEKLVGANVWNRKAFLLRADGQNLPFRDSIFDAIFCKAVLHHIPNIRQSIIEIQRVLKKNGLMVAIDEPNALNPLWHFAKFLTIHLHFRAYFLQSGEFLGRSTYGPSFNSFYKWHLEDYFKQKKFRLVKSACIWLPYSTHSKIYLGIWMLLERIVERTFIPYIFGQLLIVAKK